MLHDSPYISPPMRPTSSHFDDDERQLELARFLDSLSSDEFAEWEHRQDELHELGEDEWYYDMLVYNGLVETA